MKRLEIKSSNIVSVGHEGGALEVEFKKNNIYQYFPVTYDQYIKMLAAESKSKWFDANIKKNPAITFKKIS